jgi:prepilin-type processing-associated H-X9-DG protein
VDTRQGVSDLYTFALPAVTAGATYAASQGVPLDPAAFPTRQTVVRHLFGDVGGVSRCDEGILYMSHGPLPMSIPATFSGQQSVATTALMASILLPSLSRARELSKRTVSASNLRGIGVTCLIYANDHEDQFPPDLQTLVRSGDLEPRILISPRDPSPDECSYEYIAGQTSGSAARNVLAYEPDYDGEGGNILFADGRVEWVKPPEYQRVIDETRKRLGQGPAEEQS